MPLNKDIRKVMIIGSGPIVIGQAAEFDYAGNQACKALKEQGLEVCLVNSNPATLMTDRQMADQIYLEPLCVESLQRIIDKEKPDSLLSTLGGQTGLTLSMELAKSGFLKSRNVRLLGARPETIDKAEDRQLFKDTMEAIGEPCIPSKVVTSFEAAADYVQNQIGFPVIIRPAFTLGGSGGGIAKNMRELEEIARNGLHRSPIHQILVEKCVSGWKEIEFEVMRDSAGNVITVCSMENFDPVGIHTGDSIVVAPTMTLSDKEFQTLRSAALNIISALKIEGGCNCQFALNPLSFEYAVIEVNPRVSRSSALASKATGYPIAKVAARLMAGERLRDLALPSDSRELGCFCVKEAVMPFGRFPGADVVLGPEMKSTGEVMGIARAFPEAYIKSQLAVGYDLPTGNGDEIAFISVRDEDKRAIGQIAFDVSRLGFSLAATRGTAHTLRALGLDVLEVTPVSEEGRAKWAASGATSAQASAPGPKITELIASGKVKLIINTPSGESPHSDGFVLRTAAVEHGITYVTTLAAASALVIGLEAARTSAPDIRSLQEWEQGARA